MSSKARFTGHCSALAMMAVAWGAPCLAQTAPAAGSASIERGSDRARELKEPSFQTREERLNAKPLDWNATIGTPTPRTLTESERKVLRTAKPASSGGGKPDRNAETEARRLHPDDWK